MKIIYINSEKLYFPYKSKHECYYEKYYKKNNLNPLWYYNTPIFLFAEKYVNIGKKILSTLDDTDYIKYIIERYKIPPNMKKRASNCAAMRIIRIVDSIKKYGYAQNKYNNIKFLISVKSGVSSPYLKDTNSYTLVSRKHRAAACLALGIKRIKVQLKYK